MVVVKVKICSCWCYSINMDDLTKAEEVYLRLCSAGRVDSFSFGNNEKQCLPISAGVFFF